MVEINNQRKAFLDMLAWSEGTDNGRQKTRNHGYDVIVDGGLFTDYSDHPRKLVTLNQNSNQQAPDATSFFPVGGMPTASSLAWKTSLRKVRTLWHCSRLRAWRFTYDWSWWYPSGNRPLQQYLGFTAGRWLCSGSSIKSWQPDCKIQRSGRNGQRDWCMSRSPRLSPLWLSASSSACHGLLIITVITPLPTAQRDKNARELKLANAAITDWHRCVSVMLLRSMQNTRRS